MKIGQVVATLLALAAPLVLAGCGGAPPVRIDGSSTVYPISEAVTEKYKNDHPDARLAVGFSGTGGGMKKFVAKEIEICDASRSIKESEKESCKKAGVEYIELSVAFDGLAVMVHPENDWCDSLTVAQLKELWRPGSGVQKWKDLNPDWPDKEIKLFGPGPDSGTFDYFTEAIVGEEGATRSDYSANEDDDLLVRGVKGNKYALGYFGYAYYLKNKDDLKLLGVDNGQGPVKPSLPTVRDGSYAPLSRPLFIYVRKAALYRKDVADFTQYYLEHAAEMAQEVGYVPVSDDVAKENQQKLKKALAEVDT